LGNRGRAKLPESATKLPLASPKLHCAGIGANGIVKSSTGGDMDITIREMNPGEARGAQKLARKAFGPLEGLFVTKPKTALVAVVGGKIAAGFVYELENIGGKKIAFVSFLFTDPAFRGQGIGKRLCGEGIKRLWAGGCDALVTFVRDDNVASWGSFAENGFARASLPKAAKFFGLPGMAKLHAKTMYWLAIGHELYIALPDAASSALCGKKGGAAQVAAYVLLNAFLYVLFLLPGALAAGGAFFAWASFAAVFLGVVLAGYAGTLFSKREWEFRATSGGSAIYLLVNAFARFFPVIGNWYPLRYENTPGFRRDMAISAIAAWAFLIGLAAAGIIAGDASAFLSSVSRIASVALVYRCLPVAVFDSSGFGRVFKWNKLAAGLLAAASAIVLAVGSGLPQRLIG